MAGIRKQRRSFYGASGSYGNRYTVVRVVDVYRVGDTVNPNAEQEGRQQFITSDGQELNRISMRQFEVADTGEILTTEQDVP